MSESPVPTERRDVMEDLTRRILDIVIGLKEDFGGMKESIHGINQRLDKVNGSLGRHETQIKDLELCSQKTAGEDGVIDKYDTRKWDILKIGTAACFGALASPLLFKVGEIVEKFIVGK
jgi:hypothetical protein